MKRKLLIISLIFLLILPSISFNSLGKVGNLSYKNSDLFDEQVIEGAPYVPQNRFGCAYACLEMIFKYNGKNSSMMKNEYYTGAGYSFAYPRKLESITTPPIGRPPYFFILLPSSVLNQGTEDWEFMGSLNGVEVNDSYPEYVVNHFKEWNNWWTKVKDYINQDKPVLTSVDPNAWPIYQEAVGINETPLLARSGHAILIVGFNEKNQTICVQDPMAGSTKHYNPDHTGYQWLDLKVFRKALRRSFWDLRQNSYEIFVVENFSDTPDFDYAFELAHSRNIERLKGNISAYDSDFISPQFEEFGVDALKALKDDYNSLEFFYMYPLFKIIAKITGPDKNALPFGWNSGWHKHEAAVQDNISIFLKQIKPELQDENLTRICDYESVLFENASEKFYELGNTIVKLQDLLYNKSIIKTFLEAKSILGEVVSVLDEIISIQEAIIAGPPEEM